MKKSLGDILKYNRERRNLSIEDISRHTKISKSFIKNLEASRASAIPDIYQKYFLKTYIKFLGIEVNVKQSLLKNNNTKNFNQDLKKLEIYRPHYPSFIYNSLLLKIILPFLIILTIAIFISQMENKEDSYLERLTSIDTSLSKDFELSEKYKDIFKNDLLTNLQTEQNLTSDTHFVAKEKFTDKPLSKSLYLFFKDEVWVEIENSHEILLSRIFQKDDKISLEVLDDEDLFITSGNLGLISAKIDSFDEKNIGRLGEIGRKIIF